jgi:hypothetical protein
MQRSKDDCAPLKNSCHFTFVVQPSDRPSPSAALVGMATVEPLNLDQWRFYVLATSELERQVGAQKTIGLRSLMRLGPIEAGYDRDRSSAKRHTNRHVRISTVPPNLHDSLSPQRLSAVAVRLPPPPPFSFSPLRKPFARKRNGLPNWRTRGSPSRLKFEQS